MCASSILQQLFTMLFARYPTTFFFQAEDGIRDGHVTGVQTCALPIYGFGFKGHTPEDFRVQHRYEEIWVRSEERRVGKECRSRGWPDPKKKKENKPTTTGTQNNSVQDRVIQIIYHHLTI